MSTSSKTSKGGSLLIVVLAIVLAVVHQDFWWWGSDDLVLGFLPIGLAYHAFFSLAAAGLWALAIKVAWPHDLEAMAEESAGDAESSEKAAE